MADDDNSSPDFENCEQFSPRPYQVEILEQALKKNVIVCLGTGTGKTFISVMLIKEKADEIRGTLQNDGKRTFFLVSTGRLIFHISCSTFPFST